MARFLQPDRLETLLQVIVLFYNQLCPHSYFPIELQTDHKTLMKEIEQTLQLYYTLAATSSNNNQSSTPSQANNANLSMHQIPNSNSLKPIGYYHTAVLILQ